MPTFLVTITRERSLVGILSTTDHEFAKQFKALIEGCREPALLKQLRTVTDECGGCEIRKLLKNCAGCEVKIKKSADAVDE